MKSIAAIAIVVSSVPVVAAAAAGGEREASVRERPVCTQLQRRGGSRLTSQRVCLTQSEWRARLGNDWRQHLTGRSPEEDAATLETVSRDTSNLNADGHSLSSNPKQ